MNAEQLNTAQSNTERGKSKTGGLGEAARARAELYVTLEQLRDRLDFAQRIDETVDRTRDRIGEARRKNPLAYAAGVAAVAVGVGAIVWGVANRIAKAVS